MSSFTYYYHCKHCKPTQDSCTESHFRPCGGVDCRGKYAWKTVATSLDGAKNKTTIHSPPPNEIKKNDFESEPDRSFDCWSVECTTACSKDKCWFEAREEGESLIPDFCEDDDDDDELGLSVAAKMANRLNEHGPAMVENDPVTHPKHYTQVPDIECWDVIKHFSYLRGCAMKYLWRCGEKGDPKQDLQKAIAYIQKEISELELKSN